MKNLNNNTITQNSPAIMAQALNPEEQAAFDLKMKRKNNRAKYSTSRICVKLDYCQELRRKAK